MKKSVCFRNVQDRSFFVSIGEQEYNIDSLSSAISFDIQDDEPINIRIAQQQDKLPSWLSWLIWILTIPLQGLFSMLSVFGEDEWYKQINPYTMEAQICIPAGDYSEVAISFYKAIDAPWVKTAVSCALAESITLSYIPRTHAIFSSYIRYVKRVLSVSFIGLALFCGGMYFGNTAGAVACAFVIAGILILDTVLIISQYFKAKKLEKVFVAGADSVC